MKNLIFNWRPEGLPEDWELLLAADPSQRIIATYLEKSAFLEARREGELVGLLLLATTSSAERGEIVNLSVRPSEQNQGIGSQLIQQALTRLSKDGSCHCDNKLWSIISLSKKRFSRNIG